MIYYILSTLHIFLFCWAFYNILYFGIKPSKSLSWILITLFFPFIGVIAYVIFGINRRKLKFLELKEIKRRKNYIKKSFKKTTNNHSENLNSDNAKKISNLIFTTTNIPLDEGNDIQLLKNGKIAFDAILDAIKNAQKFIHLQYYILEDGKILNSIINEIEKKRKENVEVRILYDDFGSSSLKKYTKEKLKKMGVEIYPETPFEFGKFLFSLNHRNHRKICVIDNKIGFTGGVNISDEYIDNKFLGIWQDTHLQIKGRAVTSLHKSFLKDFYYATEQDLSKNKEFLKPFPCKGNTKLQIVSGGPDYEQSIVMQQYLTLINTAKKSICVLNPYFIPTFSILEAFKIAALSGVNVTLLLPKKGDSKIADYSMYSYFEVLIKSGVHIYLRDDFSHSKVIFIDDEISSIGSTNFDCRSFEHNYELNALIFDKNIALELREEFDERVKKATKVVYEEFKNRSFKQKTLERFARFLSPLL
ncbi:cardiolipin synthase [uncultured Polaribacter sp.]|uniref:cardiolipin synthase n=1 Tax=uncultured Polaribacter sp. TaxID=174711 RepID=UPI00263411D0|nr:cardiolipin synthase [uncultured Polaribacter sp.]